MDYKRLFLFGLLMLISMGLWNAWVEDYPAPLPSPVVQENASSTTGSVSNAIPSPSVLSGKSLMVNPSSQLAMSDQIIQIVTDVLVIDVDLRGGDVVGVKLPQYSKKVDTPDDPFVLENTTPSTFYVAQSGFVGENEASSIAKNVQFTAKNLSFKLEPGVDTLTVALEGTNQDGIHITKTLEFKRGKYSIEVNYQLTNSSAKNWSAKPIMQLVRANNPPKSEGFMQPQAYFGTSVSTPTKVYEKISYKEMAETAEKESSKANGTDGVFTKVSNFFTGVQPLKNATDKIYTRQIFPESSKGGWIAAQEHYFLSAWVPAVDQSTAYYYQVLPENRFAIGMEGAPLTIAPGKSAEIHSQLYTGPEIAKDLDAVAPHLDMTVDFGWFWLISVAIFWLMDAIHSVINNWGWSIVIVTVFLKLLFYKLSAASFRSMAKMRQVQPKIAALKERYGDDKQQFNQNVMELYKKEKVNPLGGCLPVLVQIPVFIALYWVLFESVELRQAPFIFWIRDLSVKDPFYILPVLFGITMFIQQKLSPPPPDPTQAKVMMLLPIFMTALFIGLPAGLVLYMFVNSGISIIQQWHNMRRFDEASVKKSSNSHHKAKKRLK